MTTPESCPSPAPACRFDQRPIELVVKGSRARGPASQLLRSIHDLTPALTLLATVGTVWAAWEARGATLQGQTSHRASLWSALLSEWAQPEMLASARTLRQYVQTHGPDPEAAFVVDHNKTKTEKEQADWDVIDGSRRRIGSFFNKVYLLVENELVDKDLVSQAFWSSHSLIRDVLQPLERGKTRAMVLQGALTDDDQKTSDARFALLASFFRARWEDGRRLYTGAR